MKYDMFIRAHLAADQGPVAFDKFFQERLHLVNVREEINPSTFEQSGQYLIHSLIKSDFYESSEKLELIKILVKYGANINVNDLQERTPLMCAAEKQDVAIMKYLLENGASLIGSNRARTVLSIAHHNLFRILSQPRSGFFNVSPKDIEKQVGLDLMFKIIRDHLLQEFEKNGKGNIQTLDDLFYQYTRDLLPQWDYSSLIHDLGREVLYVVRDKVYQTQAFLSSIDPKTIEVAKKEVTQKPDAASAQIIQKLFCYLPSNSPVKELKTTEQRPAASFTR